MRFLITALTLALLVAACSNPKLLTQHKVSYEVTAEHSDEASNQFLQKQELKFYIHFQGDSFYAHYHFGPSQLRHYALGNDSAILAAKFDQAQLISHLDRSAIDKYLEIRTPYKIKTQPGKVQWDTLQCKKALIIYPDGHSSELLFTKKWKPENPLYDYGFKDVNGLPVTFSIREGEATYHFKLDRISPSDQKLPAPPGSQYETVNIELLLNKGLTW